MYYLCLSQFLIFVLYSSNLCKQLFWSILRILCWHIYCASHVPNASFLMFFTCSKKWQHMIISHFFFFLNIQLEANLKYILLVWTRQLVYATLHCQSLAIYTLLPHAWLGWTLTMQIFHCHWAFTLGFMCSTELWLVILSGAY